MSHVFRFKNIDEKRNYFLKEIKQNELISEKPKKICTTLINIEHFLMLAPTITGCLSMSAFASFLGIPIGIASSAIGLKVCAITVGIKKYKSIIKEKKKKHDKIVLLTKSKLSNSLFQSIQLLVVMISFLINNVLKEYNKMKKEIKNLNT